MWHSYSEYRSPRQNILYRHQFQTWGSKEGVREGEVREFYQNIQVFWQCRCCIGCANKWTLELIWEVEVEGQRCVSSQVICGRLLWIAALVYRLIVYAAINPWAIGTVLLSYSSWVLLAVYLDYGKVILYKTITQKSSHFTIISPCTQFLNNTEIR